MIRIRFRTIIIPRGDTGFITFPNNGPARDGDIAIFSIYDKLTRTSVLEKQIDASDESLFFYFNMKDTIDLEPKTYYWDVKIYRHPRYDEDNNLIGDVVKCQNATSPSAIKGVPNCNRGHFFLKRYLEILNKEFIV